MRELIPQLTDTTAIVAVLVLAYLKVISGETAVATILAIGAGRYARTATKEAPTAEPKEPPIVPPSGVATLVALVGAVALAPFRRFVF